MSTLPLFEELQPELKIKLQRKLARLAAWLSIDARRQRTGHD